MGAAAEMGPLRALTHCGATVLAVDIRRSDIWYRIREVAQGPKGDVWLLEDGEGGRLLRLGQADSPR